MPTEIHRRAPAPIALGITLAAALLFTAHAGSQQPAPVTAWQPKIHFYSPPNWINDPNGPIFIDGQYHLFFQTNPSGDQWGNMSWGHAVSPDLFHWKQLPIALAAENGVGIFSGSTVEDAANSSSLCSLSFEDSRLPHRHLHRKLA